MVQQNYFMGNFLSQSSGSNYVAGSPQNKKSLHLDTKQQVGGFPDKMSGNMKRL